MSRNSNLSWRGKLSRIMAYAVIGLIFFGVFAAKVASAILGLFSIVLLVFAVMFAINWVMDNWDE